MNKKPLPINLQCIEHPQDCSFHLFEHKAGDIVENEDKQTNYLVFFLKGRVRAVSNLYEDTYFEAGDILFFPRLNDGYIHVLEDCVCAVHQFNHSTCSSLHCILSPIYMHSENSARKFTYNCKLKAVKAFEPYLETILTYLKDNVSNPSLWYTKHQEAIRIFSLYYDRDQLCSFLHPLLHNAVPFKSVVISNAVQANSAGELAELCGYGNSAFRRRFKEHFGMPVARWLQQERARRVNYALTSTDMPIKEIMHTFSFSSASHFNAFCKRCFNSNPVDIRKNARNKENYEQNM